MIIEDFEHIKARLAEIQQEQKAEEIKPDPPNEPLVWPAPSLDDYFG